MIIKVMSEDKIAKYDEETPHVLISISSPGGGVRIPDNDARLDLLKLQFHDVYSFDKDDFFYAYLTGHKVPVVPPSKDDAAKIAAFIRKNLSVPMLIVNCEAGISRSSGVAAAVSKFLTGDDKEFYNAEKYHPNELVKKLVLEELEKGRENG